MTKPTATIIRSIQAREKTSRIRAEQALGFVAAAHRAGASGDATAEAMAYRDCVERFGILSPVNWRWARAAYAAPPSTDRAPTPPTTRDDMTTPHLDDLVGQIKRLGPDPHVCKRDGMWRISNGRGGPEIGHGESIADALVTTLERLQPGPTDARDEACDRAYLAHKEGGDRE